jgi:hypothetical protein
VIAFMEENMKKNIDNEKQRERRNSAISLRLDLDDGDKIVKMLSRPNGLFIISLNKILRQRTPDDLDPNLEYSDVPWERSIILPHGSSDPLVARSVIQTEELTKLFFPESSEVFKAISDISWEVMNSLVFLRVIKERLEKKITEIERIVSNDYGTYTNGDCPKPLPIVEYYDIEFRAFVNEVKRCLDNISELFPPLTGIQFGKETFARGHFHKAQEWASKNRGKDSLLSLMLKGDHRWIKPWIDIRIALEHPSKEKHVETLNFSIEPNRNVRLPTWRLFHPQHDMARPQNLLENFDICIDNLLEFYEDLLVALLVGKLPSHQKIIIETIADERRDKDMPMRYRATLIIG